MLVHYSEVEYIYMNLKSTLVDSRDKLRNLLRKPYVQLGIAVFLISLLSFGIGYIFGRDFNPAPIVIEQNTTP